MLQREHGIPDEEGDYGLDHKLWEGIHVEEGSIFWGRLLVEKGLEMVDIVDFLLEDENFLWKNRMI